MREEAVFKSRNKDILLNIKMNTLNIAICDVYVENAITKRNVKIIKTAYLRSLINRNLSKVHKTEKNNF